MGVRSAAAMCGWAALPAPRWLWLHEDSPRTDCSAEILRNWEPMSTATCAVGVRFFFASARPPSSSATTATTARIVARADPAAGWRLLSAVNHFRYINHEHHILP